MGFGGVLFSFGVLIWQVPDLLRYLVAATFCAFGLLVMAFAWRLRPRAGGGAADGTRPRSRSSGSYVDFRVDRDEEPR